jgi:hypothetical protein
MIFMYGLITGMFIITTRDGKGYVLFVLSGQVNYIIQIKMSITE